MESPVPVQKKQALGLVGVIVGFIALAAAFMSPWIQDAIDPPPKPIEEVAIDLASRLANAAKAKLRGKNMCRLTWLNRCPHVFLVPLSLHWG